MPTIAKPQKKEKTSTHTNNTDMRALRQKAYQDKHWRAERDSYIKEHPICEECLKSGKVTPAQDIHHKESPFKNGTINYKLLYDKDNLMALCKDCHGKIHANQQGHMTIQDVLRQLADLLDENKPDTDFE